MADQIKVGAKVRVENQFTRPGSLREVATVIKVDPPLCVVRFWWQGKWRQSKHRIEEVDKI